MNRARLLQSIGSVSLTGLTWLTVAVFTFPIFWLVTTSLKSRVEAFRIPPTFLFHPTFENYRAVASDSDFVPFYFHSIVVAICTTLLVLALGVPAAYGLTRFKFRGRKDLSFWILSTRMAPPVAVILPFYSMFQSVGLLDTYAALIIPNAVANTGLVIWLLRSFIRDVPESLDEAARVDGCTHLQAFLFVVLPSIRNGLIASAIIVLIFVWNEYLFALLVTGQNTRTATVAITNFVTFQGINWGRLAAASVLVILPVFLFALAAQKWIIRGFTMGAVK